MVSSFTTDNVGTFCTSGAFADLTPFMDEVRHRPGQDVPASAAADYTQYEGNQCALPLLSDAYGLYYNKDAFEAAGITEPPKTMSEFDAAAEKLTKRQGDSYSQLGFMPNYHGYESTITHLAAQWSPTYFTADGQVERARRPGLRAGCWTWQKGLVDELGGYAKLEKYRATFGDEWGAKNPFTTGQVAMAIDGEWRLGMIEADAGVTFDFGVAPFPVPDDQADSYGKGYLTGTIVGIASTSQKQNAAWEFVQVPDHRHQGRRRLRQRASTTCRRPWTRWSRRTSAGRERSRPSSRSPSTRSSNTTPASPNGGAYQLTLQDLGYAFESGKQTDLAGRSGQGRRSRSTRTSRRPE